MSPRFPVVTHDLGDMPALTAGFRPYRDVLPVATEPAIQQRDAEIVGALQFLLGEIATKAAQDGVDADLAYLIGKAKAIADGEQPARPGLKAVA